MAIYRCAGCGAVNRTSVLSDVGTPRNCYRCRRLLDTTGKPQPVDAAALVTTIRSSPAPVLVSFVPRESSRPSLEAAAQARAGELVVLRVDPGEEPAAAAAFSIGGVPTLVLFQGGSEIARRSDTAGAGDVRAWVEAAATAG